MCRSGGLPPSRVLALLRLPVTAFYRWLPSVAPGSRGGGGRGVGFRGAWCRRRVLLLLPALPGGLGKFLLRALPSWAGAPVGCPRWLGCGGPRACCFLRSRSILQHTEVAVARQHRQHRQHKATTHRRLPPQRKAPWKHRTDPLPPLPRRAGSRGWFSCRPLLGGRASRHGQQCHPTASVAYPRVRSASCKIHSSTERN